VSVQGYKIRIIVITPTNYKTASAAKETANAALKAIRAGEPFEEVAKRVSDDDSAPTGGELGVLNSDQMSPLFLENLRKMKIGEVSPVLGDASSRYFLLKLEDIQSQESEKLAAQREEIRARLTTEEYQRQIALWLERQRQQAFIHRAGASFLDEVPLERTK
jgi:peptidyl-prolyl cis-trans isomerase SurA